MSSSSSSGGLGGTVQFGFLLGNAGTPSRISEGFFKSGILPCIIIACTLAALRTAVRVAHFRRLYSDDYFLFLSVLCFVASAIITFINLDNTYQQMNISQGLASITIPFLENVSSIISMSFAAGALLWASLFFVKLSFLFIFRRLIWRVRRLKIWWWIVLILVIITGAISSASDVLICPQVASFIAHCSITSVTSRSWIFYKYTAAFDIITDVGIISIPCILLWSVRIPVRKKMIVGTLLCLSIFVILISIVRISLCNVQSNGTIDIPWMWWCQFVEASVAIMMVSITAFRTLFTSEENSTPINWRPLRKFYPYSWSRSHRTPERSSGAVSDDSQGDKKAKKMWFLPFPSLPSVHFTGLGSLVNYDKLDRTVIDHGKSEKGDKGLNTLATLDEERSIGFNNLGTLATLDEERYLKFEMPSKPQNAHTAGRTRPRGPVWSGAVAPYTNVAEISAASPSSTISSPTTAAHGPATLLESPNSSVGANTRSAATARSASPSAWRGPRALPPVRVTTTVTTRWDPRSGTPTPTAALAPGLPSSVASAPAVPTQSTSLPPVSTETAPSHKPATGSARKLSTQPDETTPPPRYVPYLLYRPEWPPRPDWPLRNNSTLSLPDFDTERNRCSRCEALEGYSLDH